MASPQTVLEHHLDAFGAQDVDELMVDYTEDSVIVTNDGTFRGVHEIEEFFMGLCDEFAQEGVTLAVDDTVYEGDFAYLLWHAETPDNAYEFCTDTFYIPGETIEFQSFAAKITPKA